MRQTSNFFIASETNNYHPPVLSYKAFLAAGVFLVALRMFLGAAFAGGAAVDSQTLMALINSERNSRQIGMLATSAKLSAAAAGKSQDMLNRGYFAHVDPNGNYVWNRIIATGYRPYKILGENLAINFATPEGMVEAWLGSPKHRENLLNPEYADQGLSALYGNYRDQYTDVATSLFGTLVDSKASDGRGKATVAAATADNKQQTPVPKSQHNNARNLYDTVRWIFTLFAFFVLVILVADTVIIHRHDIALKRSHPSYHLFNFIFLVIVSVAVWWW